MQMETCFALIAEPQPIFAFSNAKIAFLYFANKFYLLFLFRTAKWAVG